MLAAADKSRKGTADKATAAGALVDMLKMASQCRNHESVLAAHSRTIESLLCYRGAVHVWARGSRGPS